MRWTLFVVGDSCRLRPWAAAVRSLTLLAQPRGQTARAISASASSSARIAPSRACCDMPWIIAPVCGVGTPAEVADVVAFLASRESRWITGSWVDATGGSLT
ncbi:SDR family oxidoreductase [Streptomyces sp. NPDC101133]|uniref:SDR family oxidoreductase n=1 Tax=Streptomyces sp. NPDC101133 TaxID=3366111 RepID=UPI003812E5ED